METENHHLANTSVNDYCMQESSMKTKISEEKYHKKENICRVSKYFTTSYLLFAKVKVVALQCGT